MVSVGSLQVGPRSVRLVERKRRLETIRYSV